MNFERKRENSKFETLRTTPIVSIWKAGCCIEHHFSLLECIIKTNGSPNKIFAKRANNIMFSEFLLASNTTTFDEESIIEFAVLVVKSDFHFSKVQTLVVLKFCSSFLVRCVCKDLQKKCHFLYRFMRKLEKS